MTGIKLEINGDFVDLNDSKMNMEIVGPYIKENFVKASGSYSFPLPGTDSMRIKWVFVNELSSETAIDIKLPAKVWLGSMLLFNGVIYLDRVNHSTFDAILKIQSGYFFDALSEKTLDELNLEIGTRSYLNSTYTAAFPVDPTKFYPDVNFACPPVYNELFYGDNFFRKARWGVGPSGGGDNSFPNQYPGFITNNYYSRNLRLNFGNQATYQNRYTPMPFLRYIVDKVFEESGWTYSGSFFENEEIKKLIMYNPAAIEETYVVGSNRKYDFDLRNHVPKITGRELLSKVKNTFCLGIFPNSVTKNIVIKPMNEVLDSTEYDDWTDKLVIKQWPNTHQKRNDKRYGLNLKISKIDESFWSKDIKDSTGYEYKGEVTSISSLPSSAGPKELYYVRTGIQPGFIIDFQGDAMSDYESSAIYLGDLRQEPFNPYTVWKYQGKYYQGALAANNYLPTPNPVADSASDEVFLEGYYTFNSVTSQWTLFSRYLENIQLGVNDNDLLVIDNMASTLYSGHVVATGDKQGDSLWPWPGRYERVIKCPIAFHQGDSFTAKYEGVFKDVCLLFYRGVQTDSLGDDYPLGTLDQYSWNGTKVGNLSLAWQGPEGIYEKWWKKYAEFLLTTYTTEFYFLLDPLDLVNLDTSRKKRVMHQLFFIDKLSFDLDESVTDKILVKALLLKTK